MRPFTIDGIRDVSGEECVVLTISKRFMGAIANRLITCLPPSQKTIQALGHNISNALLVLNGERRPDDFDLHVFDNEEWDGDMSEDDPLV